MRNTQEVVKKSTTARNDASYGVDEITAKPDETKSKIRTHKRSVISNLIFFVVIHLLDTLLMIMLLPFMLWQWASSNDRAVTLELIMWIVFAGASILMTVTFVLEDIYFRKNGSEKLNHLLSDENTSTLNNSDKSLPDADTQNCATAEEIIRAS